MPWDPEVNNLRELRAKLREKGVEHVTLSGMTTVEAVRVEQQLSASENARVTIVPVGGAPDA